MKSTKPICIGELVSERTSHFAIVKKEKRNDLSKPVERCKQAIQIERFQFLKKSYTGCIF